MNIHIFGSSNPSGQALINLISNKLPASKVLIFSRKNKTNFVDLDNASSYKPDINEDYVLVSFAPIWKIAYFLDQLLIKKSSSLKKIKGLIICSSSSVMTKRFSSNKFDKDLYCKIYDSENKILNFSKKLEKPLIIVQPTLIYGNVGEFKDRNINLIISIMRKLPFVFLPSNSGMRQPIHASQLAEFVFLKFLSMEKENFKRNQKILLGGDFIFSYEVMLKKIQEALPENDKAKRCKIIIINQRLFFFLISPINLISPKWFESLFRINSDLAGFEKVSKLIKKKKLQFPVDQKYFIKN